MAGHDSGPGAKLHTKELMRWSRCGGADAVGSLRVSAFPQSTSDGVAFAVQSTGEQTGKRREKIRQAGEKGSALGDRNQHRAARQDPIDDEA